IKELFVKLTDYKKHILTIDAKILKQFEKNIFITSPAFDSVEHDANNFSQTFFSELSETAMTAMLSKFQNNIQIVENEVVTFCNEQVGSVCDYICGYLEPIAMQNSKVLKNGDLLEIEAGLATFMKPRETKILIDNIRVP